jgi:hypothetical protein
MHSTFGVLLDEMRRFAKSRPADPFAIADAAVTRLIRNYSTAGQIRKIARTRKWVTSTQRLTPAVQPLASGPF